MAIDKLKAEEAVQGGTPFGFIPHRLSLEWKPELRHYPFNVLFASRGAKDGETVYGSTTYEPDFHTYKEDGDLTCMRYHNIYDGDCYLMIGYNKKNKSYNGKKFINGKSVTHAIGGDWKQFFIHLTMLGLTAGEACKFDKLD